MNSKKRPSNLVKALLEYMIPQGVKFFPDSPNPLLEIVPQKYLGVLWES